MGGMKASGLGRRHGADGILKYTEAQTVAVQRLLPIAPPRGVPQGLWGQGDDALAAGPQAACRACDERQPSLRVLVADESKAALEPVGDRARGARP